MRDVKWQLPIWLIAIVPVSAFSMQALDNHQLSQISGRDGVTLSFDTSNLAADAMGLRMDEGTDHQGGLEFQNVTWTPVDANGNNAIDDHRATVTMNMDFGQKKDSVGVVKPAASISMKINHTRFYTDAVAVRDAANNVVGSFGDLAYDAQGRISFTNLGGLFASNNKGAELYGQLLNQNMFWRQYRDAKSPYMVMSDGQTMWRAHNARIGVISGYQAGGGNEVDAIGNDFAADDYNLDAGVYQSATSVDLAMAYTSRFKQPDPNAASLRMTTGVDGTDNGLGVAYFGWRGTILKPVLNFSAGGFKDASGTRTEGLHISAAWNFLRDDDYSSAAVGGAKQGLIASDFDPKDPTQHSGFRWLFGNADADPQNSDSHQTPVRLEIGGWRNLPGAPHGYGSYFPDITLDMVNAGQGAAALCWGAGASDCTAGNLAGGAGIADANHLQTVNVQPTATGLGVSVRNASIAAYSEAIRGYDDYYYTHGNGKGYKDFGWGLIFTFANLDANAYLYPGGYHLPGKLNTHDATSFDNSHGITMDVSLVGQTFDPTTGKVVDANGNRAANWGLGNNLMIADTDAGLAIGMMNQSFLFIAPNAHMNMKPVAKDDGTIVPTSGPVSQDEAQNGGVDITIPQARYELLATFGGRDLMVKGTDQYPDGRTTPRVLTGGVNDWNYEGFLSARISPPAHMVNGTDTSADQSYIGYSLAFRATSDHLGCQVSGNCPSSGLYSGLGTYFATAEPSQQANPLVMGKVTGDMAFINGKAGLLGADDNGTPNDSSDDTATSLQMQHTILLGTTAYKVVKARADYAGVALPGAAHGMPFKIGNFGLGDKRLGAIVVPSGIINAHMTMKPQNF